MKRVIIFLLVLLTFSSLKAQNIPGDQLGAWYMYFFNKKFGDGPFGIQGDYQFRFWNAGSDLEQLLLRTGITYTPEKSNVLLTLGYGHITTGEFGDGTNTFNESRIYQEALLPHRLGSRVLLTHRFRYEQRWVADQNFRTRYRYNIFVNIPLNATELKKGTTYIALYNELFINGQRGIGDGRSVQYFDRNRTYVGMGYGLNDKLRMQLGWMKQTTNNWDKGQAQISLHHNW
ncbi:DUF2490 domain-containing protein [Roseivirga thermotolerans]|uniref:DUF2490 domain-containing protein n=1 Tax=Roseivirga thermotolerans TaxID=1758176 RepID=A0ABQ3I3V9_9BACT|nr:DUF2490 domain-containing protein [Roseivirga thermotolerans]GHE61861.1 hypothetical protein GCM10011340_16220 [Roseivirga thermotolerans]